VNYYPGTEDGANALVAEIESSGGRAVAIEADVTDSEHVAAMVDAMIESLGGIDILVNNAGITRDGLLVRMSDADWNAVISTNLTGVFLVTRAVARHMMKARAGAIVNVASVVGLVGNAVRRTTGCQAESSG
jgi:3-oxoacyl-[acyl-carrier protein] reductase